MPRQSFLSTDFFVNASEKEAVEALCSLPRHLPHINLLKENVLLNSMRFLYEHSDKAIQTYVDVSIFPLNNECVHISLHGSYTNGKRIQSDPDISNSLYHFEQLVYAALKNDFSSLLINQKTAKPAKKSSSYFTNLFLSMILSR